MPNLAKDFHRLYKRIGRLSDGQASLTDVQWDESTLTKFTVLIQPNTGYFKGGSFKFEIRNLIEYNQGGSLDVLCISKIYHPNIDPTMDSYCEGEGGNVCLNLLEYSMPNMGLESVVLGILFLLNNPNFDDPLYDGNINEDTFAETIQNWINGEEVEGIKYGSMLSFNGEDDLNNCNETNEPEDKTNNEISEEPVAGAAANIDTTGTSVDPVEVKNVEAAKEDGNEKDSNEVTGTNEMLITAADNTQLMPASAADSAESLNAQIEAFLVAESASGDEDECVCEDVELSLVIVDGEVLMTSRGLTVEPFDRKEEELQGVDNNTADANNTGVSQDDETLAEDGETVENKNNDLGECQKNIEKQSEGGCNTPNKLFPKVLIALGVYILFRLCFKGSHTS